MRQSFLLGALAVGLLAASSPVTAKVFFRVAPSPLPSAGKTTIQDLVLMWPVRDSSILAQFQNSGYHVWLQCEAKDLQTAVAEADRAGVSGLIVADSSRPSAVSDAIESYLAAHKNLTFRILTAGGKQPQMKGRLVVKRDGILQVSSPSTQPWLDTNFATIKLAQSVYPDSLPIMYDFRWDNPETPPGRWYPDAREFALAIAESDAVGSDVIIDLPLALQAALHTNDPQAWSLWNNVMPYLDFSSRARARNLPPIANTGIIVENTRDGYEAANLMARHNLAFEAVRPLALASHLAKWNSVVAFCFLDTEALRLLQDFAAKGGIVVFVNSHGEFPWHSAAPLRREAHSTTYKIDAGQIVELGEPVIDPETFASDLRRLLGRERTDLALWNSLTTLVVGYSGQGEGGKALYFVNYADQPDNVQVKIKGHYKLVRFESPEEPRSVSLSFVERDGFTEFTIPSLHIGARVHLDSGGQSSLAAQ